jgi:hypothetical protein
MEAGTVAAAGEWAAGDEQRLPRLPDRTAEVAIVGAGL